MDWALSMLPFYLITKPFEKCLSSELQLDVTFDGINSSFSIGIFSCCHPCSLYLFWKLLLFAGWLFSRMRIIIVSQMQSNSISIISNAISHITKNQYGWLLVIAQEKFSLSLTLSYRCYCLGKNAIFFAFEPTHHRDTIQNFNCLYLGEPTPWKISHFFLHRN